MLTAFLLILNSDEANKRRFHEMMYTEKGKRTMQQLWDETLAEQEAFGIREALSAAQRK